MGKQTKYVSRLPDASGQIRYTDEENAIWAELFARQKQAIRGKACDEFMQGMDLLRLPEDRVPQLAEVSKGLKRETGWEVAYVPALIPFSEFFALLADRKFPAATFVRTREELDYLQEPDIFHEIFGHTPLLTNKWFAEFTHIYGKLGLAASREDRVYLARMYWFTVEFGLINTQKGLKTYGAGIVSSYGETPYAIESDKPVRKRFEPVDALRTPYRIDIFQSVYFIIDSLEDMFKLAHQDLFALIREAEKLGMHAPTFPPAEKKVSWA